MSDEAGVIVRLTPEDVAELRACIESAWSEGQGLPRVEVLAQLGYARGHWLCEASAEYYSRPEDRE